MKMSCKKDSDNSSSNGNGNDSNKKIETTKGDSDFYERREKCFVTLLGPFMASVKSWLYCLTYQLHWNANPHPLIQLLSQSAHCLSACLPVWLNIYAAKAKKIDADWPKAAAENHFTVIWKLQDFHQKLHGVLKPLHRVDWLDYADIGKAFERV